MTITGSSCPPAIINNKILKENPTKEIDETFRTIIAKITADSLVAKITKETTMKAKTKTTDLITTITSSLILDIPNINNKGLHLDSMRSNTQIHMKRTEPKE